MYWFGSLIESNEWRKDEAYTRLDDLKFSFYQTSVDEIIETLDGFSKLWAPEGELFKNALNPLIEESGMSEDDIRQTLGILPVLLSKSSLVTRLKSEFVLPEVLDKFTKTPNFSGKVKAVPQGLILHVTAGNVFLSSIDSLIMGLITKNLSIIKVSGQNKFFPVYFAKALQIFDKKKILSNKFAVLSWKGGDSEVESFLKSKVNAIVAWGGEEMVASYQKNLPLGVKLLDFGPKISFQLVTKRGLDEVDLDLLCERICADIAPWDQSACASPQNLFLEDDIDEKVFVTALEKAFQKLSKRNSVSADEAVEILKEKYRAMYSEIIDGGMIKVGEDYLLHVEENKFLRPSPLNRSLIIKKFSSIGTLYKSLLPFRYYLQSCSYQLGQFEKDNFISTLALTGIKRFAPVGTITWGMDGAPHDGRFVLRELVSFVGDEHRAQLSGKEIDSIRDAKDLKRYFETSSHPRGHIFSSGGTTGAPKFIHYSYEEMDYMTDMLRTNFEAQGVTAGMMVANLFVAGNLWSSFMAVDKAMQKVGAIQLPIGGLCQLDNIVMYLQKFRPDVVLGIPSMLVSVAEYAQSKGIELKIDRVFYAGEALSLQRREFLTKTLGASYIGSAGYASVDAGVIAYQCAHAEAGVHHLFSDLVQADIVSDELVVTSVIRSSMPIINYRTGDRAEWVEGQCSCGRRDRRFKLLGRIDNQIQIWSCRLEVSDVEKVLGNEVLGLHSFQIIVDEEEKGERLTIMCETKSLIDSNDLISKIYHSSRDLKDTITLSEFFEKIQIQKVSAQEIIKNSRTGKIPLLIDNRKQ